MKAKAPISASIPTSPNSSPITEAMKVGVGLGQEKLFLDAVAEPDPQPFAPPEGDQRLAQLVTRVEGVLPGIQEGDDALHPVGRRS